MSTSDILQILLFFTMLVLLTPLLGHNLAIIFSDKTHPIKKFFGKLESFFFRFLSINPDEEMNWKQYTLALLRFNAIGFILLFLLLITQSYLPLNPAKVGNMSWHLAFNAAVSFVTNTNWQSYSGETAASYLIQMIGFTVQNFLSAATGLTVLLALIRGLTRRNTEMIGNFWSDLMRSIVYVLLPLSLLFALFLVSQGVIQNFSGSVHLSTLEGQSQILPMGPAASQIAIKQLGTNGGGFFNANSAHPFENPTPLSNFLELIAILMIPAALTYMYGKMVGSVRQGWILFLTMVILLLIGIVVSQWSEHATNHLYGSLPMMEGKETRIGITNSALWSAVTTSASNGSVNSMLDSMTPITGLVAIFNLMIGEVIFGGVGAGLYGMLIFVILTVFIAGLMVGRSPEYLGKKIEAFDVQMAILAVLAPNMVILGMTSLACVSHGALASLNNSGPHGFTQLLYAFSSAAGNNGSAFAGLNANTPFFNLTLGIGMLIGRFGIIIPVLAIAGNMARKKIIPTSSGTFHTDHPIFVLLLIAVIVIIGGLTFFPALSLGPIIEHLIMRRDITF